MREGRLEITETTGGEARRAGSDASRAAIIDALRRHGPLTRQRLVTETGLSRATVSAALGSLTAQGQVRETAQGAAGRGRPSMLVSINTSRADLVGIELGRGHVAVAVADRADAVIAQSHWDIAATIDMRTRTAAALSLLTTLASTHALDLTALRAVAVGTPGPVFTTGGGSGSDSWSGSGSGSGSGGRRSPDLALARYTRDRGVVAGYLTERLDVPVLVENNTRYTALSAAGDARNVVYLRVDEGVGGGVVVNGTLVSGAWGTAGELGHVCVDLDGPRCPCGGRGCVERFAALPALLDAASCPDLAALAARLTDRDPAAVGTLARAQRAVAQALAGVLAVLDESVVVIGGRVAELPGFLDGVERLVRAVAPGWCTVDLTVRLAADDRTAGARGALVHARAMAEARDAGDARAIAGTRAVTDSAR